MRLAWPRALAAVGQRMSPMAATLWRCSQQAPGCCRHGLTLYRQGPLLVGTPLTLRLSRLPSLPPTLSQIPPLMSLVNSSHDASAG